VLQNLVKKIPTQSNGKSERCEEHICVVIDGMLKWLDLIVHKYFGVKLKKKKKRITVAY